jgi:hypothetical protein
MHPEIYPNIYLVPEVTLDIFYPYLVQSGTISVRHVTFRPIHSYI